MKSINVEDKHFLVVHTNFLHHSTLRNLAFWMMRISYSGSKLETDYDFFVIIFRFWS